VRGELAERETSCAAAAGGLRAQAAVVGLVLATQADKRGAWERILKRLTLNAERHAATTQRHDDEMTRRVAERQHAVCRRGQAARPARAELEQSRARLAAADAGLEAAT